MFKFERKVQRTVQELVLERAVVEEEELDGVNAKEDAIECGAVEETTALDAAKDAARK